MQTEIILQCACLHVAPVAVKHSAFSQSQPRLSASSDIARIPPVMAAYFPTPASKRAVCAASPAAGKRALVRLFHSAYGPPLHDAVIYIIYRCFNNALQVSMYLYAAPVPELYKGQQLGAFQLQCVAFRTFADHVAQPVSELCDMPQHQQVVTAVYGVGLLQPVVDRIELHHIAIF